MCWQHPLLEPFSTQLEHVGYMHWLSQVIQRAYSVYGSRDPIQTSCQSLVGQKGSINATALAIVARGLFCSILKIFKHLLSLLRPRSHTTPHTLPPCRESRHGTCFVSRA